MTVTIQDVTIVNDIATKLTVANVNYQLDGKTATAFYWLSNDQNQSLLSGNCELSEATVNSWGIDDSVVLEDIANQKNFIIVSE